MKALRRILSLLAALLILAPAVSALASEGESTYWRSDIRRMNDLANMLDESENDEFNTRACNAVVYDCFDFVVITYTDSHRGNDKDSDYIRYLYEKNELGYGPNSDGIVLAINAQQESFVMIAYGRGSEIFDEDEMDLLALRVRQGFANDRYSGAIDSFLTASEESVRNSYIRFSDEKEYYAGQSRLFGAESINGYDMPDWYPADIGAWVFEPIAEDAPRVVDDADLFTDEEEARIEALIKEVGPTHEADIVVFTDTSSHGLSHGVYAADFYDFNGYGYGAMHNGFCLFICMDPADRGGWTCVTGPTPRSLYTEQNANDIDDVLYDYLGSGRYFEGVYDWVGNIGTLLDKGVPFAPDWFPSIGEQKTREHNANAPRVVDNSGVLTAEQIEALTRKAKSISDKYGVDVVINTAPSDYNLGERNYTDAFYSVGGYGFGDNYDGIILTLFTDDNEAYMLHDGAGSKNISQVNETRLYQGIDGLVSGGNYYGAADRWLNYLDKTYRTGRVPRTPAVWSLRSAAAGIVSLIGSSIGAGKAKRSMVTVRSAYDASEFLDRSSLQVAQTRDEFVNSSVSRVYSPVSSGSDRPGSSGSHGGSTYHSSYHGSSGTSHSGSGRKF
ncbi:MAG: TPM domain-containing protein [Clostridia bacterium]|nr:TPM domain-containing protein [Clostridia bacterium]